MIGIYKITNLLNGKCYIGQSNDIERRFQEHKTKGKSSRIPLDIAIQKYGADNFSYEVIEECSLEELNQKETYYIQYYNSIENGYNCNFGGEQQTIGSQNGRAKLTEKDIIYIRTAYNEHKRQKEIYKLYKDKITFSTFQGIWQGKTWKHIMPDVYTEENKKYYIYENSLGENSKTSVFTDEEVIKIRQRYVNETAPQIYLDYKDKIQYQTFQQLLWGRHYKHLPIYKKKEKKWINI